MLIAFQFDVVLHVTGELEEGLVDRFTAGFVIAGTAVGRPGEIVPLIEVDSQLVTFENIVFCLDPFGNCHHTDIFCQMNDRLDNRLFVVIVMDAVDKFAGNFDNVGFDLNNPLQVGVVGSVIVDSDDKSLPAINIDKIDQFFGINNVGFTDFDGNLTAAKAKGCHQRIGSAQFQIAAVEDFRVDV